MRGLSFGIEGRFSTIDLFRAWEVIKTDAQAPNAQILLQKEGILTSSATFSFWVSMVLTTVLKVDFG